MSHPVRLRFPTTDWSIIARVDGGEDGRQLALSELLERYLPALRSYIRAKWKVPPDRADDLLQGFIARKVLEQDLIPRARRAKGKFRTFLMTALDRWVVSEYRRETAAKRSPGEVLSLSALEENPEIEQAAPADPDPFDVAWARRVLELSLRRMKDECDDAGRMAVWSVFEARVLGPTLQGSEPVPLDELVRRFALSSPEQASNLMITAKRMFARSLRGVIREYLGATARDEEVEDELRRLTGVLARAPG